MRPHALRIAVAIIVVCLLTITSSSNTQVPAIHLSSIHGYTAEISYYHFDAEQHFCFTLTNTSSLPINAIAAQLGGRVGVTIVSQSDNGALKFFAQTSLEDHRLNDTPMSFLLFSLGGLQPGTSTTICLDGLGGSADVIARNLVVTFDPPVNLACVNPSEEGQVLVAFTKSTDTEQCLIISNPSDKTVTGAGLNLAGKKNSFDLFSVTPTPQPFDQHLRFTRNGGAVEDFGNIPINFALLSGGQFSHGLAKNGVGPGEVSSEFCIAGNFAGLTTDEIIQRAYVRVDETTRQCFNNCCPVGKGQTGVLAGEPR